MSIIKSLFDSYPMFVDTKPDANKVTDGAGRYMDPAVVVRLLSYSIDADPATQKTVTMAFADHLAAATPSVPTAVIAPEPEKMEFVPSVNIPEQLSLFDRTIEAAPKNEVAPTPTVTIPPPPNSPSAGSVTTVTCPYCVSEYDVTTSAINPHDPKTLCRYCGNWFKVSLDQKEEDSDVVAPGPSGEEIPAVSMEPFLDRAVEKVTNLPWTENVTVAEDGTSPLSDAYKFIKNSRLINFVVRLSPPSTANTGIYSESNVGGAYQCYGAVVVGEASPSMGDMPDVATGALLRARLFDLEDETPVFFHIMHRVEVVNAIRNTELFASFSRSVASEHQDRVNNRAAEAKAKEEDELGAILSDPTMVKALFARLMKNAESN